MKNTKEDKEFLEENRPSTRRGQFLDFFRHRFLDLLKISLLQTIFSLPFYASLILFYMFSEKASDFNSFFTVSLFTASSFVLTIPLIYLGLSGMFYCFRKLSFLEGEFVSSSFFIGFKEEWKTGLRIGLIVSISAAATLIGSSYLFANNAIADGWISALGISLLLIQLIVVIMMSYYSLSESMIYSNSFISNIKNSLYFSLMKFPINLLFFIVCPGIFIALVSIMSITMYVGIVLGIIFSSFAHLIWYLNALSAFDKYINKDNFPEYYRKGLRKEKEA